MKTGHSKEPYGLSHSQVREGESELGAGEGEGCAASRLGKTSPGRRLMQLGQGEPERPMGQSGVSACRDGVHVSWALCARSPLVLVSLSPASLPETPIVKWRHRWPQCPGHSSRTGVGPCPPPPGGERLIPILQMRMCKLTAFRGHSFQAGMTGLELRLCDSGVPTSNLCFPVVISAQGRQRKT